MKTSPIFISVLLFSHFSVAEMSVEIKGKSSTKAPQSSLEYGEAVDDPTRGSGLQLEAMEDSPVLVLGNESNGPKLVQFQGQSAHHTKVTYDGMDLSDMAGPTRAVNWSNLQSLPSDRILFTPAGAQSNGSQYLGGHIELLTDRNERDGQRYLLRGDSVGESGVLASTRQNYGKHEVMLQLSAQSKNQNQITGDGESDQQTLGGVTGQYQWQSSPLTQSRISLIYQQSKEDLDGFSMLTGEPADDPNYVLDSTKAGINALTEAQFDDLSGKMSWRASYYNMSRNSVDDVDEVDQARSTQEFSGDRVELEWNAEKNVSTSSKLSTGMLMQQESAEGNYTNSSQNYDVSDSFFGLHVGVEQDFTDAVKLKAHHRWDNDENGTVPGYGATVLLNDQKSNSVSMAYARQTQRPSLVQLYDPTYGNRELESETANQYNLEYIRSLKNSTISVQGFLAEYENLIDFDSSFRSRNIGRARMDGFSVSAKGKLNRVGVSLKAQKLWAKQVHKPDPLLYRPENSIQLGVDWSPAQRWNSTLNIGQVQNYWAYKGFSPVKINEPLWQGRMAVDYEYSVASLLRLELKNLWNQSEGLVPGFNRPDRSVGLIWEYRQ